MGLIILFGLVTLLGLFAFLRELRRKNFLAVTFSVLTFAVFGWFTVMTIVSLVTGDGGSSH